MADIQEVASGLKTRQEIHEREGAGGLKKSKRKKNTKSG